MFLHSILLVCLASLTFSMEAPPLTMPEMETASISSNYIIRIKGDHNKVASYIDAAAANVSKDTVFGIASAQGVDPQELSYGVRGKYESTNSMSVTLNDKDLADLKSKHGAEIASIEPDFKMYLAGYAPGKSWGLSRITHRDQTANMAFEKPSGTGKGVTIYVLDTGLRIDHPDFDSRIKMGKSFVKTEKELTDKNGHGTHVTGIIASKKYGIATEAKVIGLKVFDGKGQGSGSSIIAALDYVIKNAVPGKTVVNMSLVGPKSEIMNEVADKAAAKGIVVVVAAGNNGADSCTMSPASAKKILSVGATDKEDQAATFSNWGRCVDVYAPGVDIPSAGIKSDKSELRSGTSMAAPYAAGVAAIYLSQKSYDDSMAAIKDILKKSYRGVKGTKGRSGNGIVYANGSSK